MVHHIKFLYVKYNNALKFIVQVNTTHILYINNIPFSKANLGFRCGRASNLANCPENLPTILLNEYLQIDFVCHFIHMEIGNMYIRLL